MGKNLGGCHQRRKAKPEELPTEKKGHAWTPHSDEAIAILKKESDGERSLRSAFSRDQRS